jgi:hypothetical protein
MTKSKVEIFTASDGSKHFVREECQRHEIGLLPFGLPGGLDDVDEQELAIRKTEWCEKITDFLIHNAAAILEILKPARKARAVKPAGSKPRKVKAAVTAPKPAASV